QFILISISNPNPMFLLNYVAIAGRNLTVDNLKQKLEPYIINTESQLHESLHGSWNVS
ncbi:10854_t:CDS:1, partial [Entrophospora sp. SA101]